MTKPTQQVLRSARKDGARRFVAPRPNATLMRVLGVVNRVSMLKGLPWLRRVPVVRELPLVRGHFRIQRVDIPEADRERLKAAVNDNTAAFLAPNHPEFGFDWMMDKEISTFVAPRMVSWAAHEIVASAPWFWGRNNLISNSGGNAAMEYSVQWALRGRGVLLHPEGVVRWTGDKVHALFPGVAEMAVEAGSRVGAERPVYIVPLVWKCHFVGDASAGIHRDIDHIEAALRLESSSGRTVSVRFGWLQQRALERQMRSFGFDPASVASLGFFDRQAAFREYLVQDLSSRYVVERSEDLDRQIHRLRKAATNRQDVKMAEEARRLGDFSREVYGGDVLTQEQIYESLKRHRSNLVTRGLRNLVHNYLPVPYGLRVARLRVPEPLRIDSVRAAGDKAAYVAELLDRLRGRMQETLDGINTEIAQQVARNQHQNPFATPRRSGVAAPHRYEPASGLVPAAS